MLKKHYSDAFTPLILESGVICLIIATNMFFLVKEMRHRGFYVWYRDNFGSMFQKLFAMCSVFGTLLKVQEYVRIKEVRKWQLDDENDRVMDFYEAFTPIFICIGLFICKIVMMRSEFQIAKCILAMFLILLALAAETYFDNDLQNNVSLCILAVPISGILFCQATLDF